MAFLYKATPFQVDPNVFYQNSGEFNTFDYMKNLCWLLLLLPLVSCEDTEPIMDAEQNMLWGNGAKAWIIQKQIVDGSEIQLDTNQIKYTKIYSSDQTYYDSDGLSGQYTYDASESKLIENIRTGGIGTLTYDVLDLNSNTLVVKLISNDTGVLNSEFYYKRKN